MLALTALAQAENASLVMELVSSAGGHVTRHESQALTSQFLQPTDNLGVSKMFHSSMPTSELYDRNFLFFFVFREG